MTGVEITGDRVLAEAVVETLRAVVDPELGADIVALGMLRSVDASLEQTTVGVALTISGCPMRAQIQKEVRGRLEARHGIAHTAFQWLEMTDEERSVVMRRARSAAQSRAVTNVPSTCRVIAVGSGKGGVGKSSLVANLARALAVGGYRVGVLDADISGSSQPRMLGVDAPLQAGRNGSAKALIQPVSQDFGAGSIAVVSTGLLVAENTALLWRGAMLAKALEQFLCDVDWAGVQYLLVDLPPGTSDVPMALARMVGHTELIVVTTPAETAARVAERAGDMATRSNISVLGVVENMGPFACPHGEILAPFGSGGGLALAGRLGVPLLASIPLDQAVCAAGDSGVPLDGSAGDAVAVLASVIVAQLPVLETCGTQMLAAIDEALNS